MQTIEGSPGEHIQTVAQRAVAAAEISNQPCSFVFNGVRLTVKPDDITAAVVARWSEAMDAAARAYWTPERIAARDAEHEADRAALNSHIAALSAINISNAIVAIGWLCRLEQLAKTHTPYNHLEVVMKFITAGWMVNTLCQNKDETTEQWTARVGVDGQRAWLIGQALDGVRSVGAPHGIIHKLAADLGF